jgi:predicted amidohydrolase YtcJ
MSMIPLHGCRSAHELLRAVAIARTDAPWIVGVGMRMQAWERPEPPALADLDSAAGARPCFLWSFDHHAALASSRALAAAGINARTPDPARGRIVRVGGRPTGLLLEAAAKAVWAVVPEPSPAERRAQVIAALLDLARHGFVEIDDLLAPLWLGPVLASLADEGRLAQDVTLYAPLDQIEEAVAQARGPGGWERPGLRLGGAKLFADGTLNSRTAWMLHPYADPLPELPRGQAMHSPDQIDASIARTSRLGVGLAVHAIGDAAVRAVLDAWQRARPSLDARTPRLRIEHAEIIDEADVPRFSRLGVACSAQPCHLLADIEALRRGLPHRLDRVLPLRELIDSGCEPGRDLFFGSDVPIVRPHPTDSIRAAVHRGGPGEPGAVAPAQAISEDEAWAAFAPGRPGVR